jgi:hypothetical protein
MHDGDYHLPFLVPGTLFVQNYFEVAACRVLSDASRSSLGPGAPAYSPANVVTSAAGYLLFDTLSTFQL